MVKLQLLGLKVTVPKPKRKRNSDGIVKTGKITQGKVFQDEDGNYKVAINMKNDPDFPDLLVVKFTERSYDLTDRVNVFSRTPDSKGRITRFIRNPVHAKHMPGLPEQYVPFAPNWLVKGYLIRDNGTLKFDFRGLVGIEGYDMDTEHFDIDE